MAGLCQLGADRAKNSAACATTGPASVTETTRFGRIRSRCVGRPCRYNIKDVGLNGFAVGGARRQVSGWAGGVVSWGRHVPVLSARRTTTMTPLRKRMIDDMVSAGLAPNTQAAYIRGVLGLAAHYLRSPGDLGEEQVRR